ncbi:ankyrin repeat-containing protein [Apodospora peruviana]|uniref:Ankyrin repeat-containing protein n=1 Tax=Apodospora peruviana TaxID=516989 RepID=A0AAE0IUH4_9PEZI|nr:ankyrin repeat-containing protein [Apodospora peruviana]
MKFGLDFYRYMIPQWDRSYADYNRLKWLIKTADTQDSVQDSAFSLNNIGLRVASVAEQSPVFNEEYTMCELFHLGGQPYAIPNAHRVLHSELRLLLAAYTEYRRQMKALQWFDTAHVEAVERLAAKVHRRVEAGSLASDPVQSQGEDGGQKELREYMFAHLQRVEGLMTDITKVLALPEPAVKESIIIQSIFTESHCRHHSINQKDLEQALLNGDVDSLAGILVPRISNTDSVGPSVRNLICRLLQYSVILELPEPVSRLLSSWAVPALTDASHLDQNILSFVITAIGLRSMLVRGTKEARRKLCQYIQGSPCAILHKKDYRGYLPLHYAARYGLVELCRNIIALMERTGDKPVAVEVVLSPGQDGMTPLHLAVIEFHEETAQHLLKVIADSSSVDNISDNQRIMGEILLIAMRNENDAIVHSLMDHISSKGLHLIRTARDETVLHIAAQLGRDDYAVLILSRLNNEDRSLCLDIRDKSRGWIPLFYAAANGYHDVARSLLAYAAPDQLQMTDHLGWTAKEHAAFRGHLAVAELFPALDGLDMICGPANPFPSGPIFPTLHCGKDKTFIIASLGSSQRNKQVPAIDLDCFSSADNHMHRYWEEQYYTLEVSAPGSTSERRRIRLPILGDMINDPLIFALSTPTDPRLMFKIIKSGINQPETEVLVGSGTALLNANNHQLGTNRQSLIREQTIPVLEKENMAMIGTVTFTFLVAKPFPYLQTPLPINLVRQPSESPLLIGHRGLGMNLPSHQHLQLGENTIESFLAAFKLGAPFVEFDVQITRDLHAVIYHDFSLSESGTDVPVHDLTLEQYLYASNVQSPHGNPLSTLGQVSAGKGNGRQRSRSLGRQFEDGAIQIQDRMKLTADVKLKGYKPNTRGDNIIQDSFATLKEILVRLPGEIGLDIEIKYPRLHEANDAGVAPVAIDLNTFVDVALETMHKYATPNRKIMLSSFTPEICILLSLKQKTYPVLFITNAGKVPMADMEVRAASMQVAVQFAKRWDLAGVVFSCEVLLLCPRLVGFVKGKGLVCASYGTLNNQPGNVEIQVRAGVDIFIADRVGLVATTLSEMAELN